MCVSTSEVHKRHGANNDQRVRNECVSGTTKRKRRTAVRKVSVAFAAAIIACGVAEVAVRLAGYAHPTPYEPDDVCGYRLIPGFTGRWTYEGASTFTVNSAGFRDAEHQVAKPDGTIRIAVVGDSYVEALQVEFDEMISSQLGATLRASWKSGIEIEVLSCGVSGYGTGQEWLAYRDRIGAYDPDIVILMFLPGNDLRNNCRSLEPHQRRPYFDVSDGELSVDNTFRELAGYRRAKSFLVRFLKACHNRSRLAQLACSVLRNGGPNSSGKGGQTVIPGCECFTPPEGTPWAEAWTVAEHILEAFHKDVQNNGAEFVVAVVTSGIQVLPDPAARQAAADQCGATDLDYADRRLEALGRKLGFPVITLSEPLRRYAEENDVYLHGFENTHPGEGHWNTTGHRVAAQVVAQRLLAECKALRSHGDKCVTDEEAGSPQRNADRPVPPFLKREQRGSGSD